MQKIIIVFLTMLVVSLSNAKTLHLPDILDPEKDTTITAIPPTTFKRTGPTVQIGILLDTSNSMDGLINQAKDQLWHIVNEVAKLNKNGDDVVIQVGLFEYGKSSLPKYEGYLQMINHLTDDLDSVSESLFNLKTNGGEEYAGKVILEATNRFAWSNHSDDLKILLIAGNESFAQGNVPYKKAIQKAKQNNIITNVIYCNNGGSYDRNSWKSAAKISGGKFFEINQDFVREYIPSPYDDEIIVLGKEINKTYIYYGAQKLEKFNNMRLQDSNASGYSKLSSLDRSITKSKKQYGGTSYELVNAYNKNNNVLDTIKQENLPKNLQHKSKSEIKKIIAQNSNEREKIQKKIDELKQKRDIFVAQKQSKNTESLGNIISKSIIEQAKEFDFKIKTK